MSSWLRRSSGLLLLTAVALLTGCVAPLPETAFYRYKPASDGKAPAVLVPSSHWQKHTLYSLGLIPPTHTSIVAVDGWLTEPSVFGTTDDVPVTPGRHELIVCGQFDVYLRYCRIPIIVDAPIKYSIRAENTSKDLLDLTFYLEEREGGRRLTQQRVSAESGQIGDGLTEAFRHEEKRRFTPDGRLILPGFAPPGH